MIKKLYTKHKVIILYMLFGALTTAVNIVSYFIFKDIMFLRTAVSNMLAWFLSVVFAFVTNKLYVFDARDDDKKHAFLQLVEFFGARFISGVADTVIMVIFIDIMHCSELPVKILSNIFVIIFNYVVSKFIIFKK